MGEERKSSSQDGLDITGKVQLSLRINSLLKDSTLSCSLVARENKIFVCLLTQRLCPGSAQAELTALITAQPALGRHGGGSASQTGLPALRETTCTFVLKVFTLRYLQRAFFNLIKEAAFRRGLFSTGLVKIHSRFAKS